MEKTCMKCGKLLPIDEFYKHPQMGDGHLNKCKECCRSDTIQNRRKRIEHYREYDRSRSSLPHRRKLRKQFLQYQEAIEPEKSKARTAAGNALRDGRIRKEPCYFCGSQKSRNAPPRLLSAFTCLLVMSSLPPKTRQYGEIRN